jgi:hypothetical protein
MRIRIPSLKCAFQIDIFWLAYIGNVLRPHYLGLGLGAIDMTVQSVDKDRLIKIGQF